MSSASTRKDNRGLDQLRNLSVAYDVYAYADGSVLFSCGNTKVLCSVMMQQGVPPFLKGQKRGWLTADYAMLPASTSVRMTREISIGKRNGRSVEISRLIGRSLRSIVNLDSIGESTIFIDCDVICADGGTRGAAITGSFLALKAAESYWLQSKLIKEPILVDEIAAFSMGIVDNQVMADLDCAEDNRAAADFNFVVTKSSKLVEVQGGAELAPVAREDFQDIVDFAFEISKSFFSFYTQNLYKIDEKKIIRCFTRSEF